VVRGPSRARWRRYVVDFDLALPLFAVAALAAGAWWWRHRQRGSTSATSRTVRDAMALARAFDEAVAQRGHSRAKSRSLVAHAEALVAQGAAIGPLALEVAERWAAARYGEQPLSAEEFERYKKSLANFEDPKSRGVK
jgi:hypothetical protein